MAGMTSLTTRDERKQILATTTLFDSSAEFGRLYTHAIFLIMFGSLIEKIVDVGLAVADEKREHFRLPSEWLTAGPLALD